MISRCHDWLILRTTIDKYDYLCKYCDCNYDVIILLFFPQCIKMNGCT